MALVQAWTWFVGMVIFSNAMHMLGLLGAPRRTPLGEAPYVPEEWNGHLLRVSIGGAHPAGLGHHVPASSCTRRCRARRSTAADVPEVPIAESMRHPQLTPVWLDRFKPWLIAAGVAAGARLRAAAGRPDLQHGPQRTRHRLHPVVTIGPTDPSGSGPTTSTRSTCVIESLESSDVIGVGDGRLPSASVRLAPPQPAAPRRHDQRVPARRRDRHRACTSRCSSSSASRRRTARWSEMAGPPDPVGASGRSTGTRRPRWSLTTLVHAWRIFVAGRFRGPRRWRWTTGVAALVVVWLAGVTGYWLVWDERAQALNEAVNAVVRRHRLGLGARLGPRRRELRCRARAGRCMFGSGSSTCCSPR